MRIGEVAAAADVPAQTIRYYEQVNLLSPPARTPAGYRDYSDSAIGQLRFIRAAQAVGLTLGEIREILAFRATGTAPCGHVQRLLHDHTRDLDTRIAELTALRDEITRLARRAQHLDPRDCAPELVCHLIPQRGEHT